MATIIGLTIFEGINTMDEAGTVTGIPGLLAGQNLTNIFQFTGGNNPGIPMDSIFDTSSPAANDGEIPQFQTPEQDWEATWFIALVIQP